MIVSRMLNNFRARRNSIAPILIGALMLGCNSAFAGERVIPPSQWSWIPAWSPSGKFVAVNWPAPKLVRNKENPDKFRAVLPIPTKSKPTWIPAPMLPPGAEPEHVQVVPNLNQRRVLILRSETFQPLPFSIRGDLRLLAWSHDSKLLLAKPLNGGSPSIYDASSGRLILRLPEPQEPLAKYHWSPVSMLIFATSTARICVYDGLSGKELYQVPVKSTWGDSARWSPDGKSIAVFGVSGDEDSKEGILEVLDAATGKERIVLTGNQMIKYADWSKDGKWFAYMDKSLHIFDTDVWKESVQALSPGQSDSIGFEWSTANNQLAYMGADMQIHIFDVNQMKERIVIPVGDPDWHSYYCFGWSPNGKYLTVSDYIYVAVFEVQTGSYLGFKRLTEAPLTQWTPDGNALAISDYSTESVRFERLHFENKESIFEDGSQGNPWSEENQVSNLEKSIDALKYILGPEALESIKNTKEAELYKYTGGIGLGMQTRNLFRLNTQNRLVKYFNRYEVFDSHSMSTIIIESLWRNLNGQKVTIEDAVKGHRGDGSLLSKFIHRTK